MILSNPELELQKKRKYFILLFILLLSVKVCFSQSNYISGYILPIEGDTLHGEIHDNGNIQNSQMLNFRENDSSANKHFTPEDVLAIYLSDNRYYEKRIFDYYKEMPSRSFYLVVNTAKESKNRSAYKIIRDTAFLRVVVKGEGKLYVLNNESAPTMYFVETPFGGLKQLKKDKTYLPKKKGGVKFKTKNTIKDTLILLTSDCEEDLYFEKRSKIYLTDLIDLMMDYNSCIGSESEIIQPKQKIKARIGLNAGLNTTNLIAKGEQPRLYEKAKYNPGHGYLLGFIVDWYLNKTQEKWVLQTELCFIQKQAEQKPYEIYFRPIYSNGIVWDSVFDSTRYVVNASYLDLSVSGKYFLNNRTKILRPYIIGGIILGISVNNWNEFDRLRYKNGYESSSYSTHYDHIEAGVLGKFGLLINIKRRFGIYTEIRGSYTRFFIDGRDDKLRSTLYNLTLGIYL